MGTRRVRGSNDRQYTLFFRKVSPFSNHFPIDFESDASINSNSKMESFSCNEQFYMYNKASLFEDKETMASILKSNNPKHMKKIAGIDNIRGWNDKIWNSKKDEVMMNGIKAKFRSSKYLRFILFLSIESELVECSPFDRYWGIGKDVEMVIREGVIKTFDWGKNQLGKILDQVRQELWNDQQYKDEREYIEERIKTDQKYLEKCINKIDLICKDRAQQRFCLFRRRHHKIIHSEKDEEGRELIPEWAHMPHIESINNISICPSPPVVCDFEEKLNISKNPPSKNAIDEKFNDRRDNRKRYRSRKRSRSRSISRSKRRSRSRSRSRSKHRKTKRRRRERSSSHSSKSRSRSRDRTRKRRDKEKKAHRDEKKRKRNSRSISPPLSENKREDKKMNRRERRAEKRRMERESSKSSNEKAIDEVIKESILAKDSEQVFLSHIHVSMEEEEETPTILDEKIEKKQKIPDIELHDPTKGTEEHQRKFREMREKYEKNKKKKLEESKSKSKT